MQLQEDFARDSLNLQRRAWTQASLPPAKRTFLLHSSQQRIGTEEEQQQGNTV